MRLKEIDAIEQQIAELVIDYGMPIERALGIVSRAAAERCVDVVLLAAISVAIHLDEFTGYTAENTVQASLSRHRVISAFAADVALISGKSRTCQSLLEVWRETGDKLFVVTGAASSPQ
ncbi:MAG: hypothetical protein WA782_05180 [Sulfitobacter sp.]